MDGRESPLSVESGLDAKQSVDPTQQRESGPQELRDSRVAIPSAHEAFRRWLKELAGSGRASRPPEYGNGFRKHPYSDRASAYHLRRVSYRGWDVRPDWLRLLGTHEPKHDVAFVEEVWALRGVGRRVETRKGTELVSVIVDTSRWRFHYVPRRKLVSVSPGTFISASPDEWPAQHPNSALANDFDKFRTREEIVQEAKTLHARLVSNGEQRDGKELEKLTLHCLADPDVNGDWPIHGFDSEKHGPLLRSPNAEFRTRTYWIDPKTHLVVGFKCGCRLMKTEYTVDYPSPESMRRELFRVDAPPDVTLMVNDPTLGRTLRSEGQLGSE